MTRREFVDTEANLLTRFMFAGGVASLEEVVSWHRTYRCDCGFVTTVPGEIWDHCQECGPRDGQMMFPWSEAAS